MFKVNTRKTYFWPVEVRVLEDGGKYGKVKFDVELKRMAEPEFKDLLKQWAEINEAKREFLMRKEARLKKLAEGEELPEVVDTTKEFGDREIAETVLVGWKNVQDDEGNPLEFNDENKSLVLDMVGIPEVITRAFIESYQGIREKN